MEGTKHQQSADFLTKSKVFFVGSNTDETVLVAIHPQYEKESNTLSWWDTTKERVKIVKSIQAGEGSSLLVTDTQDNAYIFVPLSLTLYNNVVKDQLPGQLAFFNEEDMVKAFEETMKLGY